MKNIQTIVGAALLLPSLVLAMDPFEHYKGADIQISNTGSVYSETSASASSGGQRAAAGQAIHTDDASASAETIIHANGEDGTVYVKTETSENGTTKTEEYTNTIAPGEQVRVNASAKAESTTTEDTSIASSTEDAAEASVEVRTEAEAQSAVTKVFKVVPNFFRKVFGFLWGF